MQNIGKRTRDIVFIGMFAALIAAGAFVKIPLGLVPITFQTVFVIMAGLILGAKKGALAVAVYIALGLMGVPVFAAGGGPAYILKPTFGYLLGFILAAFVTGLVYNLFKVKNLRSAILAGIVGTFAVYVIGLPYLYMICRFYLGSTLTAEYIFISCFLIFLPGDIITMVLGAAVSLQVGKAYSFAFPTKRNANFF